MSAQKTGKANSALYLTLVLIALVAFIVVAYTSTMQEFDTLRVQIRVLQHQNKEEIESVVDQMNKRYLTLLKQADDIETQRSKLAAVDRSISTEREALGQMEDDFHNQIGQIKQFGAESTQEVADLQDKFDQEIKGKTVKLARLEDDYQTIKNKLEDQQTLLVIMREQSLLDRYKHPQDSHNVTDPNLATLPDSGSSPESYTPVTPVSPMTPTSVDTTSSAIPQTPSTLVPVNNRVVTDLPGPSTPPSSNDTPANPAGSK